MPTDNMIKLKAKKIIDKYINHLRQLIVRSRRSILTEAALKVVLRAIDNDKQMHYPTLFATYNQTFSKQDWQSARRYFTENPNKNYVGSEEGFMYSYVKIAEGTICQRREECGKGSYGRVRFVQTDESAKISVLKRQKFKTTSFLGRMPLQKKIQKIEEIHQRLLREQAQDANTSDAVQRLQSFLEWRASEKYDAILMEYEWLPRIQQEAQINIDVGIATSGVVIRRAADGSIYKVYQHMCYLGESLSKTLQALPSEDEKRLDYVIDLLVHVSELHAGALTISGCALCHGDIKTKNVMVTPTGLCLVDWGLSRQQGLDQAHVCTRGSPMQQPVNYEIPNKYNPDEQARCVIEYEKAIAGKKIAPTPNYFIDDEIATLRTIYHHLDEERSILSYELFECLPEFLKQILDASNIQNRIKMSEKYTLKFIAAVFIIYKKSKENCTAPILSFLAGDIDIQNKIISAHKAQTSVNSRMGLPLASTMSLSP
ncbi:MAG: hypothetical protein Q8R79_06180 [Legionellaceae bacterium]|nr:hypothetical protein [Legionellaceae bacterium]